MSYQYARKVDILTAAEAEALHQERLNRMAAMHLAERERFARARAQASAAASHAARATRAIRNHILCAVIFVATLLALHYGLLANELATGILYLNAVAQGYWVKASIDLAKHREDPYGCI